MLGSHHSLHVHIYRAAETPGILHGFRYIDIADASQLRGSDIVVLFQ